ncbi:MAG: (deoxy)nucleoside triphosphate pyrophosphohydrolase [Candidatus Omnitrophica bacterium]|nr:(deoxy)nucleoside triphosphate pyrophosphohydrolase [Candidatus Omnitrophota bacterium]
MERIHSVAAVIKEGPRYLLAKRLHTSKLPDKWEFPGGKLRPGETVKETLRREIKEELDLEIEVGDIFFSSEAEQNGRFIHIDFCFAKRLSGEPRPVECADVRWVRPEEFSGYDIIDIDRSAVRALEAAGRF